MTRLAHLAVAVALAMAASAGAHEYKSNAIKVVHPRANSTLAGATKGVAFMKIVNDGARPVRLLSASSPIARKVEIHAMSIEKGVMRMRPMTGPLVVPARGQLKFKAGSLHFMFVGLNSPLVEEDLVPMTLNFDHGVALEIELYIETPHPSASHAH